MKLQQLLPKMLVNLCGARSSALSSDKVLFPMGWYRRGQDRKLVNPDYINALLVVFVNLTPASIDWEEEPHLRNVSLQNVCRRVCLTFS